MPHGYVDSAGQPVEIAPGIAFSTPHLVVGLGEVAQYGVDAGTVINHVTTHPSNALDLYGQPALDRFQIQPFSDPTPPEGKVVATRGLAVNSSLISVVCTYADAP